MPLLSKKDPDANNIKRTPDRFSNNSPPPTRKKSMFSNHTRSNSGIFGRGRSDKTLLDKDPSILHARQRVSEAEAAEKEADHALNEARSRVKLAREHIRNLEKEALEE